MDIFAHSLWTNVMFKVIPQTKKEKTITLWGIFFGVFPDFFAFGPLFIYRNFYLLFKHIRMPNLNPEDANQHFPLENLTYHLYNYSHSLIIWVLVFGICWLLFKKFPWVLLGWGLHIGIDIFSHNSKFFPTPFLWPVSNFHVEGWAWGDPKFMIINYGLLLVTYIFLIPKLRRKFQPTTSILDK